MKSNKWKFLLTGAATLTLLTACTQASSQSATKSNTAQTTTTSTSKNKTNNSNYFTDKDKDSSYDESKASTVKLSGSSANVSGDGVAVSGSTVTISKAGTYVISGESDGVQIKVEAGDSDDVHIVLKGVTMTNTNAPISATKAGHVYLTLADGTTNTLSDSSSNNDEDAAMRSSSLKATSPSMVQVHSTLTPRRTTVSRPMTLSISQVEPIRSRL